VELSHRFTVPASVEDTWDAFNDLEMVAGCFPGASLTSAEGDDFRGTCKVKLGPIALVYSGTGSFVQRDESTHRFVIEAKGKDKRGNGTAGATVTAVLNPGSAGSTDIEVATDLSITGKPAQFGRGVMQDVSDKLLRQFVTCLESKVGGTDGGTTPSDDAVSSSSPEQPDKTAAAAVSGQGPAPRPAARGEDEVGESDDALELGATLLPALVKAYGRQAAVALGVVAGLVAFTRLLRRRRR
jgi:carbon monoxide dehydrogenase subunit G